MSEHFSLEGVDEEAFDTFDSEGYSAKDSLILAQGLLEDAVPCLASVYSSFTEADRLAVKFAVLEMAKYIQTDYFNFEHATSPFQSEGIGSYSYSKISGSVRQGVATGVPAFDRAVGKFAPLCGLIGEGDGGAYSSSEQVFSHGFAPKSIMPQAESPIYSPRWG